jgi:type IV pilus assembly protein PilB
MGGKNKKMKITENFLKKILVDTDIISLKDFNLAKQEAGQKTESFDQIIIEKGLISDEELGQLIADEIGLPFINLRKIKINREVLNIVPEIVAKKQEIIVFERTKEGLKVAMVNPENLEIREFIEKKTGEKVLPYFATKSTIQDSFKFYRKEIKEEFEDIIGKNIEDLKKIKAEDEPLPAIKTVDLILNAGYENRASDIHIEPYENKIILRYRIDGVLHDVLTLPKDVQDFLVSRIKIMARLRTDVHDAAQDGHFSFPTVNEKVDVRVSVVPIEEGEKIVMRILAEKSKKFDLKELGFSSKDLNIIKENLKKPWGMIISSGPTGCGKTTTLYAILKILNIRDVNIMTIEDPIEYDIEGINQIQVNAKTHLTFSKGLRAIMRQDPNIIMVGEIRDAETAKLAVSAAMTGHLVLSTFHAIDASTVLTRLTDIGIEPYIIASTVNIVIAQRLVRKICPKCIESYEISAQKLEVLLSKDLVLKLPKTKKGNICLFRGRGCPVCQKTGYLGRVGIFEILEMNDLIKKLVMEKTNASQIRKEALKSGMIPMVDDGLKKAENGLTTIEEIIKAVK